MTDLEKPVDFPSQGLFGAQGLLRATAIRAALLLVLILYGTGELRGKVGDGVSQAADFISAASSIPSLNFTPSMTFGNWF